MKRYLIARGWLALLCVLAAGAAGVAGAQPSAPTPEIMKPSTAPHDFTGAYMPADGAGSTVNPGCVPAFSTGIGTSAATYVIMGRDVIVILYEDNHRVRRIYLNGRHPTDLQPSTFGHSIAWWDGATLVVETIGLKSGRTVVERMRKVNEGRQIETTVDGRALLGNWRPERSFVEDICEATGDRPEVARLPAAPVQAAPVERPLFDGVWQIDRPVVQLFALEGKAPPLRAEARKIYRQRMALLQAGKANEYDQSVACKPMGDPRTSYEGQPFDIVQGDGVLFVGYTWNRMLRLIYPRDQQDESRRPAYYGSWVSRWDGEVLVLEGSGFHADTLLDAAGMPHSDALRVTQRLRLGDGRRTLEIRTTFEDPTTFTRSWSTVNRYSKKLGANIEEDVCLLRKEAQHG
jgi:hypothetical protein